MTPNRTTQDAVNEAEWARPENWYGGLLGIYASQRDARIVVPKRRRWMGWTINVGRPAGMAGIALIAALVIAAALGR